MKNLFLALTAIVAIGLTSCGSSCDANDLTASSTAVSEAASAYATDSTKCADYKSALEDYISDFSGCDGVTQESIDAFQDIADDLDC